MAIALGAIATVIILQTGSRSEPLTAADADGSRQAQWRLLPPLPNGQEVDVDGAAIAAAGDQLHVAVVDRSSLAQRPSQVIVYRREGSVWVSVGGRPLHATRGSRVVMLGGRRPCLVTQHSRRVRVWCEYEGGWRQQGRAVFATSEPSLVTTLAGAFVAGGRPYILRARLANASVRPGGLTVQGTRVEHAVYDLARNGWWRHVGGADIDPSAPGGTQRPFGFSWNAEPCIAYNRLSGDPSRGPIARVGCFRGGRWRAGQLRDVDVGLFPAASSPPGSSAVNVDGATAAGGAVYLGVDYFHGPRVDWRLIRVDGADDQRPRDVSDSRAGEWNEQGSLYSIAGGAWAIQFDQRVSPSGLRTRLRVLRIGSDGDPCQIGQPLLRDAAFQGPLYYELAAANQTVYAIATIPRRNQSGNEVRVFVLDKRDAGQLQPSAKCA